MSRYAERVAAPPASIGASTAARRQPRPAPLQRPPLWHVLQLRAAQSVRAEAAAAAASRDGLPAGLKAGVEQLSGIAMDDVRVHRNSSEPARLGALAYAQGSDIHLGPGQEAHLPHEAWHVVQQKQGRVKPTLQMKGAAVNDERGLEREADIMGARAAQARLASGGAPPAQITSHGAGGTGSLVLQRLEGAGNQQGTAIELGEAESLADAAKKSAIEVNQRARKTGDNQYASHSALGANLDSNLYIMAPFPNGSLESWLEVTSVGGGYVKRVRVTLGNEVKMDRVMEEGAGTDFQKALVASRMQGRHVLSGDKKYASKHEVSADSDKQDLLISGNSSQAADNLTKVIGEGARFAWLADKLANKQVGNATRNVLKLTIKFAQAGKLEVDPTFQELWGSWDLVFARNYMKDLATAQTIVRERVTGAVKYAGENDLGDHALKGGEKAAAQVTSLASNNGKKALIADKQGGDGMAIVTRLGMKWIADR